MFDTLPVLPPDSILGLAAACRADPNPDKVDLIERLHGRNGPLSGL